MSDSIKTSYCVKGKRQTGFSGTPEIVEMNTARGKRYALKGKCDQCGTMKFRFISAQSAKKLLSMLGLKTPLAKISVIGDILF